MANGLGLVGGYGAGAIADLLQRRLLEQMEQAQFEEQKRQALEDERFRREDLQMRGREAAESRRFREMTFRATQQERAEDNRRLELAELRQERQDVPAGGQLTPVDVAKFSRLPGPQATYIPELLAPPPAAGEAAVAPTQVPGAGTFRALPTAEQARHLDIQERLIGQEKRSDIDRDLAREERIRHNREMEQLARQAAADRRAQFQPREPRAPEDVPPGLSTEVSRIHGKYATIEEGMQAFDRNESRFTRKYPTASLDTARKRLIDLYNARGTAAKREKPKETTPIGRAIEAIKGLTTAKEPPKKSAGTISRAALERAAREKFGGDIRAAEADARRQGYTIR